MCHAAWRLNPSPPMITTTSSSTSTFCFFAVVFVLTHMYCYCVAARRCCTLCIAGNSLAAATNAAAAAKAPSPAAAAAGSSSRSPKSPGVKFAPTTVAAAASSQVALASPRGLSTLSPLKAPQVQTISSPHKALKAAVPAAAAATEGEEEEDALTPCPMMSAKSSPLMVADMREVKMGLLPGVTTPCEVVGEEEADGEAEDGMRLRKKWLGLTKLWKDK